MQYLSSFDPKDMNVLVRLDLDLPVEKGAFDLTRMEDSFATLSYLWKNHAKHVTVIAHRGHDVKPTKQFSLEPIAKVLYKKLAEQKAFLKTNEKAIQEWLDVLENLRFDPREEKAVMGFAKELAKGQDAFVNDAFATSHRSHTSIVLLPKLLPTVFGFQFEREMTVLKKLTETPKRPFIFVLGGAKLETKLPLLEKISEHVEVILLGGKLAAEAVAQGYKNRKMIIAKLTDDGLDITPASAEQFSRFILEAKTLVWNGPMGKFEDSKHLAGTKYIADTIARAGGYRVIGGGDTEASLEACKIKPDKFNHVSSGGGALMHYLAYHSLPALEAVQKK